MPDYRVAYTAQSGMATGERFRESYDQLGMLYQELRLRRSQGTERISCEAKGSYMKAFPPIDGSLRGSALDLVICDEAQEHDAKVGAALDRTIIPTMNTRPRRQFLLMGTAGDFRSTWMRRYYDRAREGAPGHALIDYGATETVHPDDESIWWATHPGLVGGLTDPDALRMALSVIGPEQFRREYLNVWSMDDPHTAAQPIPMMLWEQLAGEVRHAATRVLAFDVSPDREQAAIAGASRHPDGLVAVDLLWQGHGRDLADEIVRLCGRVSDGGRVGTVLGAPSQADVARRLRICDVLANVVTGVEYAAACQRLADLVQGARIRHAGREAVSVALSAATRAWRGDAWVWSGRRSGVDITPVVALTLAVYGADRMSVPVLV
jgi:hypothetical protein